MMLPKPVVCYDFQGLKRIAKNCTATKKSVRYIKCEEIGDVVKKLTKQNINEEEREWCGLNRSGVVVY